MSFLDVVKKIYIVKFVTGMVKGGFHAAKDLKKVSPRHSVELEKSNLVALQGCQPYTNHITGLGLERACLFLKKHKRVQMFAALAANKVPEKLGGSSVCFNVIQGAYLIASSQINEADIYAATANLICLKYFT